MRWTWRFKARTGANGHREANGSVNGDARPDFLCVGAHKGGTTWLYQQLDSHPDFWMPPVKELHYFAPSRDAVALVPERNCRALEMQCSSRQVSYLFL